jgi:hypothetical protein
MGDEMNLPAIYDETFDRMLGNLAAVAGDPEVPLVPFWPLRGSRYDAELLVIGRSVNGWIEDWTSRQLQDPVIRRAVVAHMRRDAEPENADRMAWVTDLWGATTGYSTRRSAFWRVLRLISDGDDPSPDWPSRLVWTNLYKVSPAAGWNPGADLQRAQRSVAAELLLLEIDAYAPRRVLALTGGWISPFAHPLGLDLEPGGGLVEWAGTKGGRHWVVAKHPMRKPEGPFVEEVRSAFAQLGAPLSGGRRG